MRNFPGRNGILITRWQVENKNIIRILVWLIFQSHAVLINILPCYARFFAFAETQSIYLSGHTNFNLSYGNNSLFFCWR